MSSFQTYSIIYDTQVIFKYIWTVEQSKKGAKGQEWQIILIRCISSAYHNNVQSLGTHDGAAFH